MTTIGVTLDLPDPWAADLRQYRLALGDASGSGIPAHITLLGPVDIAPELMDEVLSHLAKVAGSHACFSVGLQGTGTFRPVSPVVFISVVEGAESCAALADAVRTGPLGFDSEYPYHPHVTIANDLDDPDLDRAAADHAGFTGSFRVDHLRVYQLDGDAAVPSWVPLADLPLCAEC